MKTNRLLFFVLLLVGFNACTKYGRTRTVHIYKDEYKLKIKYRGRMKFNPEKDRITYISPNGYVKYKKNKVQFIAKNVGNNNIEYTLYDGVKYVKDEEENQLLKTIIKEVEEHYVAP